MSSELLQAPHELTPPQQTRVCVSGSLELDKGQNAPLMNHINFYGLHWKLIPEHRGSQTWGRDPKWGPQIILWGPQMIGLIFFSFLTLSHIIQHPV